MNASPFSRQPSMEMPPTQCASTAPSWAPLTSAEPDHHLDHQEERDDLQRDHDGHR
jgi:hypothetical protein